jgi:hypothetical protein
VSGGSVEQPTRRESVMRSAERWPTSRAWISPLNLALAALALARRASGVSILYFCATTASKLSALAALALARSASGVRICTVVLVKHVT